MNLNRDITLYLVICGENTDVSGEDCNLRELNILPKFYLKKYF